MHAISQPEQDDGAYCLNLRRGYYGGVGAFFLCLVVVLGALLWNFRSWSFPLLLVTVMLAAASAALASVVRISMLQDPVLRIDRHGIFDRRVTREPVPWSKIRSIQYIGLTNPYCLKVDVGNRRSAGIALAPWTFLGTRRAGMTGWDDVVIDLYGLSAKPPLWEESLITEVIDRANALKRMYT